METKQMDYQDVANEINKDINEGVYSNFPELQNKLLNIAHKCVKSYYIENVSLNGIELKILSENEYIPKFH